MGERIPGAQMVELPGSDHLPWEGDQESLLDEIEALVRRRGQAEPDRVLATLLVVTTPAGGVEAIGSACELRASTAARSPVPERVATFDGPARAVRCALAITAAARASASTPVPASIRARSSAAAVQRRHRDVCARIADLAEPGEVLVSGIVKDIVAGSGIAFEERTGPTGCGYSSQEWQTPAHVEGSVARAIGINHVALDVGSVDEALEFWRALFPDLQLRGRSPADGVHRPRRSVHRSFRA